MIEYTLKMGDEHSTVVVVCLVAVFGWRVAYVFVAVRSTAHYLACFSRDLNLKFEFWMCWSLLILAVCVCVCRGVVFLFLDGTMVNFAEHYSILLAFLHGNNVDHAFSSWKRGVALWNKRKGLFLVILAHQWWFCNKKCYKHHFQSWKSTILLVFTCSIQWCKAFCLFVWKKSRKWHCKGALSIVIIIIIQNRKSFWRAGAPTKI